MNMISTIIKKNFNKKLLPYQKKFINCKSNHKLIVKSRMTGLTTTFSLDICYKLTELEHKSILFCSFSQNDNMRCKKIIKDLLKNFNYKEESINCLSFKTNKLYFINNINQLTGFYNITDIYLDEFGYFNDDMYWKRTIYDKLNNYISLNIGSTKNVGSLFNKMFYTEEKDMWTRFVFSYKDCHFINKEYIKKLKENLTEEQFKCEFEV